MHIHNTIIIGGGPSGLGCAKRLMERGIEDFLMITKDIGGRAVTSSDGQVNYGAYYVRKDYTHLLPYMRCTRMIRMGDACFAHGRRKCSIYDLRNLRHLPAFARLALLLLRVHRRYLRAKKLSETMEQRETIERDPLLLKLYTQPATELIEEYGLQFWAKEFLDPFVRTTAFLDLRDVSALVLVACLLPIVVTSYEFEPMFERLIEPFFVNIRHETVTQIRRSETHWTVTSAKGTHYHANHVVLAVPINVAKTLVPITEETNPPVSVYMAHLRGIPRHHWEHPDFVFFPKGKKDIVFVHQQNGTYLFYSRNPHYDLSVYFREWEIIGTRHWHPAFHLGTRLLTLERGNGLFVIGDHNLCGMEDSFVTGIFAANRIADASQTRR